MRCQQKRKHCVHSHIFRPANLWETGSTARREWKLVDRVLSLNWVINPFYSFLLNYLIFGLGVLQGLREFLT